MPATTPYATYPTGPPPPSPVRVDDRTGTIVSAVIGAVCLLLTIAVIAFTSDELSAGAALTGAAPTGSARGGGGPDLADDPIPESELKRSFPLPPGTGPSHLDENGLIEGTRAYDVRLPLQLVRKFYDQRLARLGYSYQASPTTGRDGGQIVAWAGTIFRGEGDSEDVAFMTLNEDYFGGGPGVVTIQVRFT
jgi:hypothetical protein